MPTWLEQITPLPITRPSTVHGYANGDIPASVLVKVDDNGARLIEPVAHAWMAMKAAAAGDAVHLGVSSVADAYRSYRIQASTFRARYTDTGIPVYEPRPAAGAKRWNGDENRPATWWTKNPGVADAAVPGTSNHGWACAVDVASAGVPGRLAWLEQHAWSYGFQWENRTENWHLTYVAADVIPPALRLPPPDPPIEEPDDMPLRILILQDAQGAAVLLDGFTGRWLDPERYNAFHYFHPALRDEPAAKSWLANVTMLGALPPGVTAGDVWGHQPDAA